MSDTTYLSKWFHLVCCSGEKILPGEAVAYNLSLLSNAKRRSALAPEIPSFLQMLFL